MNCPPGMSMPADEKHTIEALCQRSRDISLEKGWLNPDGTDPRKPSTVLNLFVSEISEAFEEYRAHKPLNEIYYEVRGHVLSREERLRSTEPPAADVGAFKPCGIPIEIADLVIRICQRVGSAGEGELLQSAFDDHLGAELDGADFDDLMAEVTETLAYWYRETITPGVPSDLEHTQAKLFDHLGYALALLFYFAERSEFDLWAAIDEKEAYNRTRPTRHGNKRC